LDRININIKSDDISVERALWNCLRGWQEVKETGRGVVTFQDGQKISLRKNQNGNLSFHVYENKEDD